MLVLSNTLGKEGGLLDVETLIERFMNIRTHPRARHKPLLLLLALSRVQHGESQFISYAALEPVLRRLLIEYGDLTSTAHPEYPFWWLQTDGIWQVEGAEDVPRRARDNAPTAAGLRRSKARAGFADDVQRSLEQDEDLLMDVARGLLDEFIPQAYHHALIADLDLRIA